MKRVMYYAIIMAMLIITIFGRITIERFINNNYIREGIVVATRASTEEIVLIDTTGNEWRFYGVGYEEGDTVTMIMNKNNTDNIISDDIIKDVIVNTY